VLGQDGGAGPLVSLRQARRDTHTGCLLQLGGEHQWTLTRFPQEYTDIMSNLRGVVPGVRDSADCSPSQAACA
jgi:hypothetical protein